MLLLKLIATQALHDEGSGWGKDLQCLLQNPGCIRVWVAATKKAGLHHCPQDQEKERCIPLAFAMQEEGAYELGAGKESPC